MFRHRLHKQITLGLSALCLCAATVTGVAQTATFYPGRLIVKFEASSQIYRAWQAGERRSSHAEFLPLLGEHRTEGYISAATLQALQQRISRLTPSFLLSPVEEIARICVIDYSAAIDPRHAAAKIGALPDVEYAEPMPRRELLGKPDDPLVDRQYYLDKTGVYDAWDIVPDGPPLLLAVVDSGIEYEHEDLADNIYTNTGEDGLDNEGNSRRTNGIDDDGNGFVDDLRGWDFIGNDNDASFGNDHGLFVSGVACAIVDNTIGIAGAAGSRIRLLPVKAASDNPNSISISRGHEGIAYAAALGADVINCSWGGLDFSLAEEETIALATALGAMVVAAGGNRDGRAIRYPAGYRQTIAVVAVDADDRLGPRGITNYHPSADLSAPGVGIYTSAPNSTYAYDSGTSLASPLVAGIAALVRKRWPEYSPARVQARLQATADDVDQLNPDFAGAMGSGRVNALRALSEEEPLWLTAQRFEVRDANGNGVLEAGERVDIAPHLMNMFAPLQTVRILADHGSLNNLPDFLRDEAEAGDFDRFELKSPADNLISFVVPENVALNSEYFLLLRYRDGQDREVGRDELRLLFNPEFVTMAANNIALSFNNLGHLGSNDFDDNLQGDGFRYRSSENLLYEGGLIVARSAEVLSNSVHRVLPVRNAEDFIGSAAPLLRTPGRRAAQEGEVQFRDLGLAQHVGCRVTLTMYQFSDAEFQDLVFPVYEITNTSGRDIDGLYLGIYLDWDLSEFGADDLLRIDQSSKFAYAYDPADRSRAMISMQLLSGQGLQLQALDINDVSAPISPSPDFSASEKFLAVSSGVGASVEQATDVAAVIGAGPFALAADASETIAFALGAAYRLDDLQKLVDAAPLAYNRITAVGDLEASAGLQIVNLRPNPLRDNNWHLILSSAFSRKLHLELVDALGRRISARDEYVEAGLTTLSIAGAELRNGAYLLRVSAENTILTRSLIVAR